jgi:hypothetical protein
MLCGATLAFASCDQSSEPKSQNGHAEQQRIDVSLEREGIITVHHPGEVPPISLFWEEDGFIVNHNLGKDGAPFSIGGNVFRVWMRGQKEGKIWVTRGCSDEELLAGDSDRSQYVDYDGDGVVDYKRNGDGVFRVSEIVWEKIGDIPDVPPDAPNPRVDTHQNPTKAQQGVAPQSATRSESDSEGGDKPQPESETRSR